MSFSSWLSYDAVLDTPAGKTCWDETQFIYFSICIMPLGAGAVVIALCV